MNERMLVRRIKKKNFLEPVRSGQGYFQPWETGRPCGLEHFSQRSYPYRNLHGSPIYEKMMGRVPLKY